MCITAVTVKMWELCVKVSLSTIVCLYMQRERSRCEGQCLACDAALLKSALNITTYLARDLPHPVTVPTEPLMSVYMRSSCGNTCT